VTWSIRDLSTGLDTLDFRGRIGEEDALRQHKTVQEILERLGNQPGVVLADEVGMGKTFVALGAAVIAAQQDLGRNPVVVMIPPSLREKWPRDAEVFASLCLPPGSPKPRFARATRALHFLRMLDDPPGERPQIIFLLHGAFHVKLIDPWIKLALIRRAMHNMKLGEKRTALPRFAASILRMKSRHDDPRLYELLLRKNYEDWKSVINAHYRDYPDLQVTDDPIPKGVIRVLEHGDLDLKELRTAFERLPARGSAFLNERLAEARHALQESIQELWPQVLKEARFRSPLLILDEAHHLKNPATRLASLFAEESQQEAALLTGAFSGRFERMLFMTATPFQLGHTELISVLTRFKAVQWKTLPTGAAQRYAQDLNQLSQSLDTAQQVATDFDRHWQRIPDGCGPGGTDDGAVDEWWRSLRTPVPDAPAIHGEIARSYDATLRAMAEAERRLRPWIIRHRRSHALPDCDVLRRLRRVGRSVVPGSEAERDGLPVANDQLLPFLLAARAQSVAERLSWTARERYLTFSEGLASSYEAFLETSRRKGEVEVDDAAPAPRLLDPKLQAYVERLQRVLPVPHEYGRHPKMQAVVDRVVELWALGEKVVVFCHYRKTGQALVRHISTAVERRLWLDLSARTGVPVRNAEVIVERFGKRFDANDPMARHLHSAFEQLVAERSGISATEAAHLHEIVRRFVRSSIFVARYFDPTAESSPALMTRAMDTRDGSGISLRERLRAFVRFFAALKDAERTQYLEALERVQPGARGERTSDGEDPDAGTLLPNVRLANGNTRQDARQRLMLSFNTPFFPDILVASSVLAEGVDLHLNCRHVIHHDLSWNPSDIEQRTGRVDRLGSKAEQVRHSVEVYLPFVAETQDEKQFRVVMDRERWFQVLMGEEYRVDDASVEKMAVRIPLPDSAAQALAFKLEVHPAAA
jgi:hypothetical protein